MSETWIELDLRLPLKDFDLSVSFTSNAPVVGIFGPSGAGKSSLLESIAGVRKGALGSIKINGKTWLADEVEIPAHKRQVGWVPQDHRLFPHWSVKRNLQAAWSNIEVGAAELDVFEKTISVLELEPLLDRMPETLSGGERQRVALGRALCARPEILMLDEPLSSMDKRLRAQILKHLREIQRAFEIPTIVISHEPTELQVLCSEIAVLKRGKILDRGSPATVLTRYFGQGVGVESGEFVNVFEASFEEVASEARLRIGESSMGPLLYLPGLAVDRMRKISIVEIASSDVLISSQRVEAISARNQLSGEVSRLEEFGGLVWVHCRTEGVDLVASLTPDAVACLQLRVSSPVNLIIKAQAIRAL
ncbi:MAG: molybdenum ABC transporter ATP-binding protein [Opitutales bacterium]